MIKDGWSEDLQQRTPADAVVRMRLFLRDFTRGFRVKNVKSPFPGKGVFLFYCRLVMQIEARFLMRIQKCH